MCKSDAVNPNIPHHLMEQWLQWGISLQNLSRCSCPGPVDADEGVSVQVADALNIHASMVSNVIVWGNATSSSVLDILHGSVRGERGFVSLQNCVDEELVQIISQAVRERTALIVQVSILMCKTSGLSSRQAKQQDCCAVLHALMLTIQPRAHQLHAWLQNLHVEGWLHVQAHYQKRMR